MIAFRILFPAAALFCLCSCGESFTEVVERHQADLDTFKADLASIADAIPEKPEELALVEPLEPAVVFIEDDLAASNVFITTVEQLTDPEADLGDDEGLDFYLNDVKNLLIWAEQDEKAFDDFEENLQAAFKLRYVVVYQNLAFQAPSMIDDKTYDRGGVVLAVHLYDRDAGKIVCSFPVAAQAAENVSFNHESGTSGVSEGLRAARSTLWSNAGDALMEALKEKIGGTFEDS